MIDSNISRPKNCAEGKHPASNFGECVDISTEWIKIFAILAITITLIFAPSAQGNEAATTPSKPEKSWQVTPDLEIIELQPGLWIHRSWWTISNGKRYPSNGVIVLENDAVLVIDTAWGEASTVALLDWIDEELAVPVSAVIATHAHADRMGGAHTLKAGDIPLYAHPLGFDMAGKNGWPQPLSIGQLAAGEAVEFGAVEVFYPGPAHTHDNLMVWIPESAVLVGGCAVKSTHSKTMGNTADASLTEWPVSILRASDRYPEAELVIPGHGDPGGQELLLHTTRLLESAQ